MDPQGDMEEEVCHSVLGGTETLEATWTCDQSCWGSWVQPRGARWEVEATDSVHSTDGGRSASTMRSKASKMQKRGP